MNSRKRTARATSLLILLAGILFTVTGSAQDITETKLLPSSISSPVTLEEGSPSVQSKARAAGSASQINSRIFASAAVGDVDRVFESQSSSSGGSATREGWFPNPNRTRLYFGPTGRTLRKGEGYFSDIYLFLPGIAYGVTDNITIGGGGSIVPGLDPDEQFYYLTPKVGLRMIEQFDAAVSAFMIRVPDFDEDDDQEAIWVGVLFFSGTIGTDDRSFTFGVGYGFADDEMADRPAIELGGEYRLGRRISFVSENWIFPGVEDPMISYGFRFMGEKMAIDLGFINVASDKAVYPGIPWIDFVFNF